MTPYIFPGLKPPTSQLFFDLQAMIAKNGGRIKLAQIIENEKKANRFTAPLLYRETDSYSPDELRFLIENYRKISIIKISQHLKKRSYRGLSTKIFRLKKQGIIK